MPAEPPAPRTRALRIERLALAGDPHALVARIRTLAPGAAAVGDGVAAILRAVRERGDAAVRELTERLDTPGRPAPSLRVLEHELAQALAALDPAVRAGLELAAANVGALAAAARGPDAAPALVLAQGQRLVLREVPVARAAIYVPGGRAAYPSTVVMGVTAARAAGVAEIVVCAPPARDGAAHPVILAACALLGVDEVYRMGGAQAVGALAYGTASVARVDVVVGPGNLWVQEAKRQLGAQIGIDGFAGPSDLLAVLSAGAPLHELALDLLAQGEHGPESLVLAVAAERALLDELATTLASLAAARPSVDPAVCALVEVAELDAALAVAEAFAPEHLQLAGGAAEALAPRVRRAGCLFVGGASGTAFGDYVVGSNHVLPTAGAARFASALGPRTFRRTLTEVHVGPAAGALAAAAAPLARAEGFPVHAESMEARAGAAPAAGPPPVSPIEHNPRR